MKIVNILQAKKQLSKLIRLVRAGGDVIIANRGEPVARLTAVESGIAGASRGTAVVILEQVRIQRSGNHKRSARAIYRTIADERSAWD